jgi:hypothetical protein
MSGGALIEDGRFSLFSLEQGGEVFSHKRTRG